MRTVPGRTEPATGIPVVPALIILALCGLMLLFRDSLGLMFASWRTVKHGHGLLLPGLVVALLWLRAEQLDDSSPAGAGAWSGLLLLLVSVALLLFGELSAVYTVSQFGFVVALWGLTLSAAGLRRLPLLWLPLLCLLFMVPLPQFLSNQLIALLQLIAALLGMLLIRAAGFAVFLEGNLVDVGVYQVSVVEACSSVLMVLPLLSIAVPGAVLFRGRWWQRGLLLCSAVLIPVGLGGLRLAVTGLLARYRDAGAAETFLHASAGVPLYLACAGLLLLLIRVLAHRGQHSMARAFALKWPAAGTTERLLVRARPGRPLVVAVTLIVVAVLSSMVVSRPDIRSPERLRFDGFPLQLGDWQGSEGYVDPAALASLKLADHLMANYQRPADQRPVSLWIAWYDAQVHGASVHSPLACLPGAGWRVESVSEFVVPGAEQANAEQDGTPLRVNRTIIALGSERQLIYYWFAQRGRDLTSEYLVKWYIFQDGLLMQRSDGALIRLTTTISDTASLAEADARLTAFALVAAPLLRDFVPGADARLRAPLLNNR